jgi:hypothetical protein
MKPRNRTLELIPSIVNENPEKMKFIVRAGI